MKRDTLVAALEAEGMSEAATLVNRLYDAERRGRSPRRPTVSTPLTEDVAKQILHLHRTTEMTQHQIAAALNVNGGRVAEVVTGQKFPHL